MSDQSTQQRLLAAQPQECPLCGSAEIAPTFEGRQWDCATCEHEWED